MSGMAEDIIDSEAPGVLLKLSSGLSCLYHLLNLLLT